MNTYRNKKTGAIVEIFSTFGSNEVWELISPAPAAEAVKAEPKEEKKEEKKAAPKKATTRKAVKK